MPDEMMKQQQADHDLLIEIKTTLGIVVRELKEMKDNMTRRVDSLEDSKLSIEEAHRLKKEADTIHHDFETRIRRLERWGAISVGAIGVIQFLLNYIK